MQSQHFKHSFAWLTSMKKLIFDYGNFFGLGHFLIHEIKKIGQKMTGAKKSKVPKITLFMPVDNSKEFLKSVLYFQTFLPGLLPHCNLTYKASEKIGQKRTGPKKSKVPKITLLMPVDLTNEFLKSVLYFQTFLPGLLPHCNLTYKASVKKYLTT